MPDDRDIEALRLASSILDPLHPGVRRRVLRFLIDRYSDEEQPTAPEPEGPSETEVSVEKASRELLDLEALYMRAKPTAQWERALLTGYWLQEIKRQNDFDAMAVNQAMRQCGYGISNITRELTKLTGWKLIVQQSSRSGRRRFRVSPDGLAWARQHLGESEG